MQGRARMGEASSAYSRPGTSEFPVWPQKVISHLGLQENGNVGRHRLISDLPRALVSSSRSSLRGLSRDAPPLDLFSACCAVSSPRGSSMN